MKKLKLTKEQYSRLFILNESTDITGGINRVDNTFKKEFRKVKPIAVKEEPLDITKPIEGMPKTKMVKKPEPKPINEDIVDPEIYKAIHELIKNIWLNPSQKSLDPFFIQNGITWGDIISYLTSVGVVGLASTGIHRLRNYFKRKFSPNKKEAIEQKSEDVEKISAILAKDENSPWNKKVAMQQRPESDWKAKPKPFNPNRFTPPTKSPPPDDVHLATNEEDDTQTPQFTVIGIGKELVILNGPDGNYVYDYSDNNKEFKESNYELEQQNITDYINNNIDNLTKGNGVKDFDSGVDLVKIDPKLKQELIQLYSYDKKFIDQLTQLDETTGASSSGAFTAPLGASNKQNDGDVSNDIIDTLKSESSDIIDEMTAAGSPTSGPSSTTTGQYVQPAIWANGKKNWKPSKKTQYAGGSFVKLNSCTKLNNNKSAQNGKCSQGAIDNVVTQKKTNGNVNAPSLG